MEHPAAAEVRPAQFADDQWYPSSARHLRQTLESLLASAPKRNLGRPLGLVSPHAGLRFSGQVAAHAYRQLEGYTYDCVAVVSPVHRHFFGPYVATRYRYYSTPLGLIPLAEDLLAELAQVLPLERVGRDDEHSLEIQLPFLQYVLGDGFELLPIMMGEQSEEACHALAQALVAVLRDRAALVVASSDLSHFHPYDEALELDQRVVNCIRNYDPESLARVLASGQAEACGGGPIITAMHVCRELGATHSEVLHYANSGDVWRDRSSVVGYVAAAFYAGQE